MSRMTIVLIVLAALVGLFFGNAVGGIVWGLIFAVVTAVAAWLVDTRTSKTEITIDEPAFAHFLFKDPRSSVLWLPVRLFVGWEWLDAGWHKVNDPKWLSTGESLKAFWGRAVQVPDPPARPAITYEWWRNFLQGLLDNDAYKWFGPLIAVGETLVGLGLIVGALVGIAAFFGILMNTSFLLSGSTSVNPIMLLLAISLILAWKVAGWLGLDRWLLPWLGTPWQKGVILRTKVSSPAASTPETTG